MAEGKVNGSRAVMDRFLSVLLANPSKYACALKKTNQDFNNCKEERPWEKVR